MRKILKYIDSMDVSDSTSANQLSEKLGEKENKIELHFQKLIDDDRVINLSSKLGMEIGKKRGVDYLSLYGSLPNKSKAKKYKTIAIYIAKYLIAPIAVIVIAKIIIDCI